MNSIFEFLATFQEVVKNFIADLHELVRVASGSIALLTTAIAVMPNFIKAFALLTITVLMLYLILNRGNGS